MKASFLIILAIFFVAEFYIYQAVKTLTNNSYIKLGYGIFTLSAYALILYWLLTFNRAARDHHQVQLMVSAIMVFVFPKILALIFLLVGDISRILEFGVKFIFTETKHFPERRKFISITALAAAGVFSAFAIDGIIFGKYRHTARKVKLKIKNLPEDSDYLHI